LPQPVLGVGGWLLFGPRGQISWRVALLALVFPFAWLVFTLVRGPMVDFYPYPFLDVARLGYPTTLLNAMTVLVLLLLLAAGVTAGDRALMRLSPGDRPSDPVHGTEADHESDLPQRH
jgi:hypothetical protein